MTTLEIYNKFKSEQWNGDHCNDYVVCACAKNENDYIVEWIEHYLSLGFNKFVIADNNDNDSLYEVVKSYIENGTVFLIDCRQMEFYQVEFYTLFCTDNNFKWCAFFDIDEFLEIYSNNIETLLSKIDEDVLCFNWLLYDSNGEVKKKEGGVKERFKKPVLPIIMTLENMFFKSIVKGGQSWKYKDCCFNGSHLPFNEKGNLTYNFGGTVIKGQKTHVSFPMRYKYGFLKHYYTKSLEEWLLKAKKGWPDGTDTLDIGYYFTLNSVELPIERFTKCLFCNLKYEDYNEILKDWDVIQVVGADYPFALVRGLFILMSQTSGHTFIITEKIDDALYDICLENAFKTNNRLVYCEQEELWDMFLTYTDWRNDTYYILTFY